MVTVGTRKKLLIVQNTYKVILNHAATNINLNLEENVNRQ